MIRGLTLTHPWAFAIARLGKNVENRSWHPSKWGGRTGMFLAIHGSKVPVGDKLEEAKDDINALARQWEDASFLEALSAEQLHWLNTVWLAGRESPEYGDFITPGIVAVATLRAVWMNADSPWAVPGQYHWCLADVTPIEPVPYSGSRGLWGIDAHTIDILKARYAMARDGEVFDA